MDFTLTVPSHISLSPATRLAFSASQPMAGFAEYHGFTDEEFKLEQTTRKTHALACVILTGVAGVAVIAAMVVFQAAIIPAAFGLGGLAIAGIKSYLKFHTANNQFPPSLTAGLTPQDFGAKRVGELIQEQGSAHVLRDSVESKKCKLDLIRHAQSSIFLSTYMGEEAFDEALDLIKEQMERKRDLKVFISGSEYFVTPGNQQRLKMLQSTHPDRFFSVLNQEIYLSQHPHSGHLALSTNHTKLMSIDQGAYTIVGGSALRPYWTDVVGTEHLSRKTSGFDFIHNPLIATGFRDMDFAFKSARNGAGTTAFLEGAKLMLRYAYMQNPEMAARLKNEFQALMRKPVPATIVPSLEIRTNRAENVRMKWYSNGPDHIRNSYLHALIDLIDNAAEKIVIGQMFFHPPQTLIDALSRAAKRGVKIDLITNSKGKEAPLAHRFFVDLAQNKYRQLFEQDGHQNIKVYEFDRANTTYHKKVIVVDDRYTGFGSGNFGKKSLDEHAADYEFNGIVDSSEFARETLHVLQKDIELSHEISQEKARNLSWDTRLAAWIQEMLMVDIL